MINNTSQKQKRRAAWIFVIISALLLVLSMRLGYWMILQQDDLTARATSQQTRDAVIEAKRGTIYDRNGKELATTSKCYTVYARPKLVMNNYTGSELKVLEMDIASITNVNYEDVEKRLQQENALVTVAKYLTKEQAQAVRKLKYQGIEIAEGTKRYYPLGNFASQLLGSVNDENHGRTGIELQYDNYLSGTAGRWVIETDIQGNELAEGASRYYEAQDGLNVILTIDEAIQYYVEKALSEGMISTGAKKIECIAMDPKTGEILASCVTPGFDPNDPMTPQNLSEKKQKEFDEMDNTGKTEYLSKMWRNPLVSDTYEPGSTFKLITSSSALEERTISLGDSFNCGGYYRVAGWTLHCWGHMNHGWQTIKEAVGNSCNPVLAQVARKMGPKTFKKYIDLYGISEKTGIDYPGESNSILNQTIGPVECATMGYGHGISITPIQLITAVSAIGNDGVLLKPHYVKALTDQDGKVVKTFEPEIVRQVISKDTADTMLDIMEYVVSDAGGKNAKIKGYRIGGKTGTAYKAANGGYVEDFYSSFIGMAPINDPQIALLVVVDSPKGSYYGSAVAAPIAKAIFENVLRYMNVPKAEE